MDALGALACYDDVDEGGSSAAEVSWPLPSDLWCMRVHAWASDGGGRVPQQHVRANGLACGGATSHAVLLVVLLNCAVAVRSAVLLARIAGGCVLNRELLLVCARRLPSPGPKPVPP